MLSSDLLSLRGTQFALWRPTSNGNPPVLVIGTFASGNPNALANRKDIPLVAAGAAQPGLWVLQVARSGLDDGIYHYWF